MVLAWDFLFGAGRELWGDLCDQIKVICEDETAQARSSAGIRESAQAGAPEVGSVQHIRTEQSLCPP